MVMIFILTEFHTGQADQQLTEAEDNLQLLIFLLPPLEYWNYSLRNNSNIYVMLSTEPSASCRLGQRYQLNCVPS